MFMYLDIYDFLKSGIGSHDYGGWEVPTSTVGKPEDSGEQRI